MAGIENVGMAAVAIPRPWTGARPATGFAVPADTGAGLPPDAPSGMAPTSSMDGVLGLQESGMGVGPDAGDDTPARRHVNVLLAELVALQRALLAGGDPASVLVRLDAMVDVSPATGSPALLGLLAAVRLRARVELARRGWGSTDNPFIAVG